jgi:hypothetical protein
MVSSMSSGVAAAREIADWATGIDKSAGMREASPPPNLPMAEREGPQTKMGDSDMEGS